MKPFPFIFLILLLTSCDQNSDRLPQQAQRPPASGPAKTAPPANSAHKEPALPERISLAAAEFHSELAESGLGPVEPVAVAGNGEKPDSASSPPELQFTRVAGAKARYCGTLSAGPIRCWGKGPLLVPGNFIDVAVADEGYCGVELNGKLTCEKLAPPQGAFTRIVASGKNYCAVSPGGAVVCFGAAATPPLGNQRVGSVTTGNAFACASDPTDRLVCWGPDAPILPIDPFRVKDMAAGSRFLCYLEEDGSPRCLGQGPRLPEGKYAAVNAGYDTVCGIATDGSGRCFGGVEVQTQGPVRQFAVAEASVCAHRQDGRIECWGEKAEGQLVVPTEARLSQEKRELGVQVLPTEDAPSRVEPALWLEFLGLFPSRDLPLSFDEKQVFDLGGRIPAKFAPLTGQDPNRLRAGIGMKLEHQIVGLTLFDLEERVLLLHLYKERRLVGVHELLRWDENADPLKERPGGGQVARRTATLQRSLVTTGETIEVVRLEGTEVAVRGMPKSDGTREVVSARCDINKTTYVLLLLPEPASRASATRKEGTMVERDFTSADKAACGARLPFRSP